MTKSANIPYAQMDAPTKAAFWKAANDCEPAVSAHAPACFAAMMEAVKQYQTIAIELRAGIFVSKQTGGRSAKSDLAQAAARMHSAVANFEESYCTGIEATEREGAENAHSRSL